MLENKDLENIKVVVKDIVDSSIKSAFQDFYEHIFEPYVNKNEREHEQMITEIKSLRKDVNHLKTDMDEVKEYIKDHDKRIEKLEASPFKN